MLQKTKNRDDTKKIVAASQCLAQVVEVLEIVEVVVVEVVVVIVFVVCDCRAIEPGPVRFRCTNTDRL